MFYLTIYYTSHLFFQQKTTVKSKLYKVYKNQQKVKNRRLSVIRCNNLKHHFFLFTQVEKPKATITNKTKKIPNIDKTNLKVGSE